MKTKITAKRTHLIFKSMEHKKEAVSFLLSLNLPFTSTLRRPFIQIAPSNYLKKDLDLYLPEHISFTHFNYKTN